MKFSIIDIIVTSDNETTKLLLQNVPDPDESNEQYLTSRKHLKELRNFLLRFERFSQEGKFLQVSYLEMGDLLKLLRDCLFYGRRNDLINFAHIWVDGTNIKLRMADVPNEEDEKNFSDFLAAHTH